ncbi:MAG TPA: molybdopterin-dependent oxidoreductase [Dehalococcoidales bacterium]|nr:molybdopterin-dependent oxidoreductase [Dehalococcoidales bacterium]
MKGATKNSEEKIVKTICFSCRGGCGVFLHVKNNEIIRVEGDPEHPGSKGTLCPKGLAVKQLVHHPDRLKYPLRRVGKRGEGKWERISWDQAFDEIAARLQDIKEKYGAEAIVQGIGTGRNHNDWSARFCNHLGTPNANDPMHFCIGPRCVSGYFTFGIAAPLDPHYGATNCLVAWGRNEIHSHPSNGRYIFDAFERGSKLIVVDPRLTKLASRADIWLQIRPGGDSALALSMIHTIIGEELYDKEFVAKWCYGFDELKEHVEKYTPEWAEPITWLPAEKIRETARLYATTKPACIAPGVAVEQQMNSWQTQRALYMMAALTGNIDVPGGNILWVPPLGGFFLNCDNDALPPEQRAKAIEGGCKLNGGHEWGPPNFVLEGPPLWQAILTGKPYPVKAIFWMAHNPMVGLPNTKAVKEALEKVEFLVVGDFFMTPTTEMADIVLPNATWPERSEVGWFTTPLEHPQFWDKDEFPVFAWVKAVQVGESKQELEIYNELAKRMKIGGFWDTMEEAFDFLLKPVGVTWEEFKKVGILRKPMIWRKFEHGLFHTPSGKFEFYSERLRELGYPPMPEYVEGPESPISASTIAREYPLVLITGSRIPVYYHTDQRNIPWLREIYPVPLIEIHPDTAAEYGIKEGDWVFIETRRGRVKQKAKITLSINPRVVHAVRWWYPEKPGPDHGIWESSINVVTLDSPYDPGIGSPTMRGLLCKIYKATEEEK